MTHGKEMRPLGEVPIPTSWLSGGNGDFELTQ